MPVLWWMELSLVPLMGRAASGGVFWAVYELIRNLGSLSPDGWDYVPILLFCFFVFCFFLMRHPAVEPEGNWKSKFL